MDPFLSDNDEIWTHLEGLSESNNPKQSSIHELIDVDKEFVCTNCGQVNKYVLTDGDYSCESCNTIESRYIDGNAEWRYYGFDDNKSANPTRVGTPSNIFIPKSSLGTIIGTENVKKNGYEFQRIRRFQMFQSMPYKERSLLHVMESLNTVNSNCCANAARHLAQRLSENIANPRCL